MGRVDGKVALVTGAARGQGRSHAELFALEGADVIALDVCDQIESVEYAMATPADLAETAERVARLGARVVPIEADVRDFDTLQEAVQAAAGRLGRLDVVCANAGIASYGPAMEISERAWQDVIDVNLTGVWHTCKAAVPLLSRGGSVILAGSTAALIGTANTAHYSSSKHGLVGLMKVLAIELAEQGIRVNSVHPTVVDTPMVRNEATFRLFRPDLENPTEADFEARAREATRLPISWVEAIDVSNAVLFLASDESRYITGVALPIDGGQAIG